MPTQVIWNQDALIVALQNTEAESQLRQERVECPIDLDEEGSVLGIEVEAPCLVFGQAALEGADVIDLNPFHAQTKTTPSGRTLSSHAAQRPPIIGKPGPWASYEKQHDMLYIYVDVTPSGEKRYQTSIPTQCVFFVGARGQIQRIVVPLSSLNIK